MGEYECGRIWGGEESGKERGMGRKGAWEEGNIGMWDKIDKEGRECGNMGETKCEKKGYVGRKALKGKCEGNFEMKGIW